ncbi:MAG: hypothetical protein ACYTF7_12020 [Planctomycetota bacterium]|jgi:hypothetical protein
MTKQKTEKMVGGPMLRRVMAHILLTNPTREDAEKYPVSAQTGEDVMRPLIKSFPKSSNRQDATTRSYAVMLPVMRHLCEHVADGADPRMISPPMPKRAEGEALDDRTRTLLWVTMAGSWGMEALRRFTDTASRQYADKALHEHKHGKPPKGFATLNFDGIVAAAHRAVLARALNSAVNAIEARWVWLIEEQAKRPESEYEQFGPEFFKG